VKLNPTAHFSLENKGVFEVVILKYSVFIAAWLFLSSCSTTTDSGNACGPCSSVLPSNLDEFKSRARQGDEEAARSLVIYYQFEAPGKNESEYLYWLQVAANIGDSTAQHDLSVWLLITKKPQDMADCENGLYWLKKAASQDKTIEENPSVGLWKAILNCQWEYSKKTSEK